MQGLRQGEPGSISHVGKADHAEAERHRIAEQHPDQDRSQLADALGLVVQHQHGSQRQGRDQPVLPGAIYQRLRQPLLRHHGFIGVAGAAGHVVDGGRVEGEANGEHHRAGDDRREQPADLLDEHAHQHSHDAAHDHGAGNGRHSAAGGGDGLHTGNIGKADTQDHRQARAEPPADGIQLEECAHGGHHQGCLDQQHLLLLAEADGSGDDDRRGDTPHDHGHQMLQGQGERGAEGRNSPGLKQQLPAVKARLHGQDSFRAETPRVLWCGSRGLRLLLL